MSSLSYWNDVMDEEPTQMSSDRRVGSVPHKSGPRIDDFFNESSEEPSPALDESYKNTGAPFMPSPSHRRSRSLNSSDMDAVPPIDLSFAMHKPSDLLPHGLKQLASQQKPTPSLELYEAILERDSPDKINKANKQLQRFVKNKTDPKELGKIYRQAAEINKRNFLFNDALNLYEKATETEPGNAQNYMDHSKVLEELGQIEEAENILRNGIFVCAQHEQLTPKLLKMLERRQKFEGVRKVLGALYRRLGVPAATPSLLEGILFEIRHGDIKKSLNLLSELEKSSQIKYGFFVELAEDIRRRGLYELSLQCSKNGIEKFPLMPSNWLHFISMQKTPQETMEALNNAAGKLSPSTMTKIAQTAAFQFALLGDMKSARRILAEAMATAANDQRWRFLYNSAIIEALFGQLSLTEKLLNYTLHITPQKSISTVLMVIAKYYEQINDIKNATRIYKQLRNEFNSDWRIFLEYSLFLIRRGNRKKCLKWVRNGLETHSATGRLWALYVQLEEEQQQSQRLVEAIMNAPKSGEIWVEAARIAMNPLSPFFNLKNAEFFLTESFLFTPQYADIFIEMVRLALLKGGMNADLSTVHDLFLSGEGNYGTVIYMFRKPGMEFTETEFQAIVDGCRADITKHAKLYSHAIARSSFVVDSVRHEEENLRNEKENESPFSFSFGLTSFFDAVFASSEKGSPQELLDVRKSIIFGTSMVML